MNSLSWLIYLAEVIPTITNMMVLVICIITVTYIILWIARGVFRSDLQDYEFPCDQRPLGSADYRGWQSLKNMTGRKLPYAIVIILMIIVALSPSSRTIYMIAASEIGEKVVTSPDAVEMLDDLKVIIKNRLKEEVEGKKK